MKQLSFRNECRHNMTFSLRRSNIRRCKIMECNQKCLIDHGVHTAIFSCFLLLLYFFRLLWLKKKVHKYVINSDNTNLRQNTALILNSHSSGTIHKGKWFWVYATVCLRGWLPFPRCVTFHLWVLCNNVILYFEINLFFLIYYGACLQSQNEEGQLAILKPA